MNETRVFCLCSGFHDIRAFRSSLYLFEQQTYSNRVLYILDNEGRFSHSRGRNWVVVSDSGRLETYPAKYNYLFKLLNDVIEDDDIICIWDDKAIYLPRYIEGVVKALEDNTCQAAKPSKIFVYLKDRISVEDSSKGVYHNSLALKASLLRRVGGWINTEPVLYDSFFLSNILEHTELADSSRPFGIQFIYCPEGLDFDLNEPSSNPSKSKFLSAVRYIIDFVRGTIN